MALLFALLCTSNSMLPAPSWHNTSLTSLQRTNALIASLTLNEKVSLLQAQQPAIDRIGLPGYRFGRECERGDTSGPLGTAYPTGIALGGTFDIELIYSIAVETAIEVRGNVNTATTDDGAEFGASCFGPVSNLVRDPRWGRAAEMLTGEDPQLGRIMSRAFTWGMQRKYDKGSKARMVNTIGILYYARQIYFMFSYCPNLSHSATLAPHPKTHAFLPSQASEHIWWTRRSRAHIRSRRLTVQLRGQAHRARVARIFPTPLLWSSGGWCVGVHVLVFVHHVCGPPGPLLEYAGLRE